jgi:hypothetical protein
MSKKARATKNPAARWTTRDRRLALNIAASVLAASALAGCGQRGVSSRAPDCASAVFSPREGSWDDPDGCWENRPDGRRVFRTVFGGYPSYYSTPPAYSHYYVSESSSRGSRWFWSSQSSATGYHGAPKGAG